MHRISDVRTYCLTDEESTATVAAPVPSEHAQRQTVDLTPDILLNETPTPTPQQAPMWHPQDFVPGFLSSTVPFWRDELLKDYTPDRRSTLLGWLQGVSVHEFVDPTAHGVFQGHAYNGKDLTAVEIPNHVPTEFETWVDLEIDELVKQGSLAKWSEVADVSTQPRPRMVLPLGVEPSKPRLFWDGRYLNLMCTHMPFAMDSVGKVAQCSWFGAHQVTLDHKSEFHHVALDAESWQYFGLCWQGVYHVFTVLCFGWCSSPYIYHTLSSVVGQYLRARDTPVLVWIDDFCLSNFRSTKSGTPQAQFRVAQAATYLALSVFYKAGYFMSASKCVLTPTTRLVFLGVVCDTTLRRFEVPQDKLDKLEQILNGVVETGSIYFATFEKLAGPERQVERESHARYNRAIVWLQVDAYFTLDWR